MLAVDVYIKRELTLRRSSDTCKMNSFVLEAHIY